MTPTTIYALAGAALFGVGLSGVFLCPHVLRKILAVNIAGSGIFLVLVGLASRANDSPPDPVPRALVLTGIVVAVSTTAVALALYRQLAVLIVAEQWSVQKSEKAADNTSI